ncbi:MAG: PilT protein domain-containing protein [candidate division WS6 bacterium 34_10]|uniref:PilT protein domain-containing protein n=1 Tax=candidate division WS6 bacterium 34_10 TaxID=1641389 RepID=A0A101HJA8_9BACT|nr:MAG: PilT protein domain-containing protein [candidate division WS6 bacterium 34_10]
MKTVYLDTNIFMDILTNRNLENISIDEIKPFLETSSVYMSTLSVHIAYYVLKIKPNSDIDKKVRNLLSLINLVNLDALIINKALNSYKIDFEDTLQYYSAISEQCEYILTRDIKDFKKLKRNIPSEINITMDLRTIN